MGVITISTHHYLLEIISFSINKIVQDEALAAKYVCYNFIKLYQPEI